MKQLFFKNLSQDTILNQIQGEYNFIGFEGRAGESLIINDKIYNFSEGNIYNRSSPTLLELYNINIASIKCKSDITELRIIFG